MAAFQQSIRLKPVDVLARFDLGMSCVAMGEKNQAIQVYRKLQTLDGKVAQKLYAAINRMK